MRSCRVVLLLLNVALVLRGRHANIRTVMDERIVRWRYRLDMLHSRFCLLVFLGQGGLFEDGIFLTSRGSRDDH